MADEHKKNFLEELQSLDEATKQKVIIVATVVIMVVIVYFWLAYFNNLVAGVGQVAAQQPAASATPAAAATPGPGIFERMGAGFAAMDHWFANLFQAPKQYIVKP
jgi:hypothetical protein